LKRKENSRVDADKNTNVEIHLDR